MNQFVKISGGILTKFLTKDKNVRILIAFFSCTKVIGGSNA